MRRVAALLALLLTTILLTGCVYDPYTGTYRPCCAPYYGYPYGYPYYRYPPPYAPYASGTYAQPPQGQPGGYPPPQGQPGGYPPPQGQPGGYPHP